MYVEADEVRAIATGMGDGSKSSSNPAALDDEVLETLIEQASRIFDLHCGVEPEYFEARDSATAASALDIYGSGTNHLKLPPYVAGTLSATIAVPEGYTVPEFAQMNGYLVITVNGRLAGSHGMAGDGWYAGEAITLTAKWGFESTPADVKKAVIELVIDIWRNIDPVFAKLVNVDNQPIREKLPPQVAAIAKKYRDKQGVFV